MNNLIIAIDGPAGSGKSTTARHVAEIFGLLYIDTGAMYRAVTLAALRAEKEFTDAALSDFLEKLEIRLVPSQDGQRTFLNGEDVSDEIRSAEVTRNVSMVSSLGTVRSALVRQQRAMGESGGIVMDGRDIGTVVFPDAHLKIFLVASAEERARRRAKELESKGEMVFLDEIKRQIELRDKFDSEREIDPLRKADDAILLDTSNMTIEEQTAKIVALAREKMVKSA